MGVEFSCPTLIRLLTASLPVPWRGEDSAAVTVDGSADSNGAAMPAAASFSVSRRLKGSFMEQPPSWGPLIVGPRHFSRRLFAVLGVGPRVPLRPRWLRAATAPA